MILSVTQTGRRKNIDGKNTGSKKTGRRQEVKNTGSEGSLLREQE